MIVKKPMLFQRLVDILLIFKIQLERILLVPSFSFYALLGILLYVKFWKQGNTLASLFHYISSALYLFGTIFQCETYFNYIGMGLSILNYLLIRANLYHLPEVKHKVAFNGKTQILNNKEIFTAEWVPLDQSFPTKPKLINWTFTGKQISTALLQIGIKPNTLLERIGSFFMSFAEKIKIKVWEGKQKETDSTIVFSCGRSTCPFFYSVILRELAKYHRVLAPYHSQDVYKTKFTDMKRIKEFRQGEVKERHKIISHLIQSDGKKKILVGHSYGGGTIIQAYHQLQSKENISMIILFDPWLFPLEDHLLEKKIDCPILCVTNQKFLRNQDLHTRINKFTKVNQGNISYVCLKKSIHEAQTDMGFIAGDILGRIKNTQLSQEFMQNTVEAVSLFMNDIRGAQLSSNFHGEDLGLKYTPNKWDYKIHF